MKSCDVGDMPWKDRDITLERPLPMEFTVHDDAKG